MARRPSNWGVAIAFLGGASDGEFNLKTAFKPRMNTDGHGLGMCFLNMDTHPKGDAKARLLSFWASFWPVLLGFDGFLTKSKLKWQFVSRREKQKTEADGCPKTEDRTQRAAVALQKSEET